jgi:hypothetical protein
MVIVRGGSSIKGKNMPCTIALRDASTCWQCDQTQGLPGPRRIATAGDNVSKLSPRLVNDAVPLNKLLDLSNHIRIPE